MHVDITRQQGLNVGAGKLVSDMHVQINFEFLICSVAILFNNSKLMWYMYYVVLIIYSLPDAQVC